MADDLVKVAIQTLEASFVQDAGYFQDKSVGHALESLCHCLREISGKPDSYSTEEKQKLVIQLKPLQINLFHQLLVRFLPAIPTSAMNSLFDAILCQIQIEMDIDERASDSYFELSLSCLTTNSVIDYLLEVRPSNPVDERFLQLLIGISYQAMLNKKRKSSAITVTRKKTPTFFQLNSETDHLLRVFLTYFDRHFRDNPMSHQQLVIFHWVQQLIDFIVFVPFFVSTGYPEMAIQWLSIEPNQPMISIQSWRECLDLVHNIARQESGIEALNKLEAIPIIKKWKERYFDKFISQNDESYEDLLVLYYMTYALLIEPALLKREDTIDIQIALGQLLDRAIQAFQSVSLQFSYYNVSEFLAPLAKFSVNDKCLLHMLARENMFEFFMEKFLEFNRLLLSSADSESSDLNTLICSQFYTIFWSISFQLDYHPTMKNNTEFVRFIEQIAEIDSSSEEIAIIKRSAKGIRFNLDLDQSLIVNTQSERKDQADGIRVMVSYAHRDSSFCRKLVSNLQGQVQGDVWVDYIKLEPPYEDDWEEIAEAITHCDVVVMIVTANYCDSKSCRREVVHADKRKKRMIPVYQGLEYEPPDWFEIRAGSATWVRFNDTRTDEEVMAMLVKMINSQEKIKKTSNTETVSQKLYFPSNNTVPPKSSEVLPTPLLVAVSQPTVSESLIIVSPALSTPRKPIEQWTGAEVQQWLRLPISVLQLSCGRALLSYARLISDEGTQRDEYERILRDRGLTREQWANLLSSFSTLRTLHTIQASPKTSPEQWLSCEVKYWFEKNNLPNYLLDTLAFVDGVELVVYAKMMTDSSERINVEYDRLRFRIRARYNGQDLLQLDEYARFVRALRSIVEQLEVPLEPCQATESCNI
ncbi:unnamed protein product [Rotaria socialis]|uniref:TIR domain-containing protein n=1 Tax=Rotaria socialis TaxID=392032 RepID=A0A821DQS4_9BILA|nr:unnamed protein product [Rotaria socialis]CAF4625057.1 unnamed protein product [Rotaria socialis]